MKGKVLVGVAVSLAIIMSLFVGRSPVIAGNINDPVAIPTPISKGQNKPLKQREIVFLDTWDGTKLTMSDVEWKKELTQMEYYVLRQQGTERAYSGELTDNKKDGTYYCNACGLALFSSKHKYNSETGWPSFYQPLNKENVGETEDKSIPQEVRTEVHCNRCGGHLGHVFDDGPEPTGLRYCINSVSLRFKPSK